MNIEITNLTNRECDDAALLSVAEFALTSMGIHIDSELSMTLVDEVEMSELHMRWMDEPGATDVLSFPMDEMKPHSAAQGPGMVGDIVLCPDFAARQAASAGAARAKAYRKVRRRAEVFIGCSILTEHPEGCQEIRKRRRSMTLVPVGPVTTRSPSASKKG